MSKSEEAFKRLRCDILSARLPPGAPLTIASLRQRYGVGWTPLREALPRLEAERLVDFSANKGYRVAWVSEAELRDLQKAREAIEMALFADAIQTGDADWDARILAAHDMLAKVTPLAIDKAEAVEQWGDAHSAFHKALLSAGRSGWLRRYADQITDHLHRHHRNLLLAGGRDGAESGSKPLPSDILEKATGLGHHTRLMEAALARDLDRALPLMLEHIGFTLEAYESWISLQPAAPQR